MRKTLIVGNWKMHLNTHEASLLLHRLSQHIKTHRDIEVVLAPSMLVLQPLSREIDPRKFKMAAQNAYHKDEGAYTGEVSFAMLRELIDYALVGHSERRHVFGETLEEVRDKVTASVRNGITPILCIGETKEEKLAGETAKVLHDQLMTAISDLTAEDVKTLVVAYEPVWAISNGSNYAKHDIATPDQVSKAVKLIRHNISELYGAETAEQLRVLYGGSSNPENTRAYLSVEGVDGLLPGGASLNYHEFPKMVDIAYQIKHSTSDV